MLLWSVPRLWHLVTYVVLCTHLYKVFGQSDIAYSPSALCLQNLLSGYTTVMLWKQLLSGAAVVECCCVWCVCSDGEAEDVSQGSGGGVSCVVQSGKKGFIIRIIIINYLFYTVL